jgi:short-subunit dehydrogenase
MATRRLLARAGDLLNLLAGRLLTLTVLGGMIEQGYGRIINVSSGIAAAPGASPGLNAYATAKAGLEAHALGLAAELAGTGTTVKVVLPARPACSRSSCSPAACRSGEARRSAVCR